MDLFVCGISTSVVLWCVVRCRSQFSWVRPRFGRSLPQLPSARPSSAGPPKISIFFSPVFEASVPTMHVWAHGLSCETRWLLQNVKNNLTIDLHPITSEKINDQLLQILLVSRKKPRTQPKRLLPPHLRDPHLLALTFSGFCLSCFCLPLLGSPSVEKHTRLHCFCCFYVDPTQVDPHEEVICVEGSVAVAVPSEGRASFGRVWWDRISNVFV